jgi:hypothetical protein
MSIVDIVRYFSHEPEQESATSRCNEIAKHHEASKMSFCQIREEDKGDADEKRHKTHHDAKI